METKRDLFSNVKILFLQKHEVSNFEKKME